MTLLRALQRTGRIWLLLLVLAALWFLSADQVMSLAHAEIAGSALDRGLLMLSEDPTEPNPYLDRALRNYQAALAWNDGNAHAWRKLGELYLLLGQNQAAQEALSRAVALCPEQPLYHLLLGDAWDGAGSAQEAVAEWELGRGLELRRDQMVVNYTKLADAHIQMGDPLSAIPTLRDDVLRLEPSDLFALSVIVTAYDGAVGGPHPLADPYRERVEFVEPEALRKSSDPRYTDFQARAVLRLYQGGQWTAEKAAGVVSYWAWLGHPAALPAARSLHDAAPDDERLVLLLAETLIRRKLPAEALSLLEGYPGPTSVPMAWWGAQARLAQARLTGDRGDWEEAVLSLEEYQALAPTDLFPMMALIEARESLGADQEAEHWRRALEEATEGADRLGVAEALGMDPEDVQLGPNLVLNGDFEVWLEARPENWLWSDMATGNPWNRGVFVGGHDDELDPWGGSLRVQCLWRQEKPELEVARAGFWYYDEASYQLRAIVPPVGLPLAVSFDYRTEDMLTDQATLWLSGEPLPCFANDLPFPATFGEWHHVTLICRAGDGEQSPLNPLLRLFGPGTVTFDNLKIRTVVTESAG